MRTIKINKTQMYGLLQKYCPYILPKMKVVEHEKANRADAYWMRFADPDGKYVTAYLEMHCEEPKLRITCKMDDYDRTIKIDPKDIEEYVIVQQERMF
ncbi:hypothetical protein [Ruminococcus sp.]|uniref:hypothetical protein n=1 Tax=Ruminococcus sp. TaxID=41978 RepID=UPI00352777A3